MATVKVTTKFQILDFIDRFVDGTTGNAIGSAVVKECRKMIAEGQSPVRGHKRFGKYKDRKKYPGKRKAARPVNLYMTGEMLDKGFGFRFKKGGQRSGGTIEVGMIKGSEERKEIAGYHHDGTPNMVQRRFVPGSGEHFAVSVMRVIRDLYGKRLTQIIAMSNKKR